MSDQELYPVFLETMRAAENPQVRVHALLLVGGSVFLMVFYQVRSHHISKRLPRGHSPDLTGFTRALMVLAGWNMVTAIFASKMTFNTSAIGPVVGSATDMSEIKNELAKLLISSDDASGTLNRRLLWRDCRMFAFSTISMIMLHSFLLVLLRIIEYVTLIIASDKEKPLRPAAPRHRKSVSFDKTLTTYLDSQASYSDLEPCDSSIPYGGFMVHYGCLFALAMVVLVLVVPRSFLLNSLARLFTFGDGPVPTVEVKFDHVYLSIVVLFLRDVLRKFVQVVKHPQFRNFPHMTSVFSRFTWGYSCLLLTGSIAIIVFFSDVLINIFSVICEYTISDDATFDNSLQKVPRQFITLIIMSYLAHSLSPECPLGVEELKCSRKDSLTLLLRCFTWLRAVFSDCWVVSNMAVFLLFPLFIWIIVVELKIGWGRLDRW